MEDHFCDQLIVIFTRHMNLFVRGKLPYWKYLLLYLTRLGRHDSQQPRRLEFRDITDVSSDSRWKNSRFKVLSQSMEMIHDREKLYNNMTQSKSATVLLSVVCACAVDSVVWFTTECFSIQIKRIWFSFVLCSRTKHPGGCTSRTV